MQFFDENINEIVELGGVYVGDSYSAGSLSILQDRNIVGVLRLTKTPLPYYASYGIEYHIVAIDDDDSEPILDHFEKAFDFLDNMRQKGKGNVLIHCDRGISRTGAFATGYVMRCLGNSFDEASDIVAKARWQIDLEKWISPLEMYEFQLASEHNKENKT